MYYYDTQVQKGHRYLYCKCVVIHDRCLFRRLFFRFFHKISKVNNITIGRRSNALSVCSPLQWTIPKEIEKKYWKFTKKKKNNKGQTVMWRYFKSSSHIVVIPNLLKFVTLQQITANHDNRGGLYTYV